MKLKFDPNQILFHGTLDIYASLIKEHGIKIFSRLDNGADFGPGFYVSVGQKLQAIEWDRIKADNASYNKEACDLAGITLRDFIRLKNSIKPVIMLFKIRDLEAWLKLRYKIFETPSLNWKELVWKSRNMLCTDEEFDWVFGPVADGGIYESYSGLIRPLSSLYNQLCISSPEASNMLELLEVRPC